MSRSSSPPREGTPPQVLRRARALRRKIAARELRESASLRGDTVIAWIRECIYGLRGAGGRSVGRSVGRCTERCSAGRGMISVRGGGLQSTMFAPSSPPPSTPPPPHPGPTHPGPTIRDRGRSNSGRRTDGWHGNLPLWMWMWGY